MITGLNHITLSVTDVEQSFHFYSATLGFKPVAKWKTGAYLEVGDVWLCLSADEKTGGRPSEEYTHIAFSISPEDFSDYTQSLLDKHVEVWKENKSEGDSFYFLDPDGHKLEVHVGNLKSRIESLEIHPYEELMVF